LPEPYVMSKGVLSFVKLEELEASNTGVDSQPVLHNDPATQRSLQKGDQTLKIMRPSWNSR
jgi:hypothetical protein